MNIFITEQEIKQIVRSIAVQIAAKITHGQTLTLLCVLKGSLLFTSDLMRELFNQGVSCKVEFIRLSSYEGTKSSGRLRIIGENYIRKNEWILIVEDIIDSGRTLKTLTQSLKTQGESLILKNFQKNAKDFSSVQGMSDKIIQSTQSVQNLFVPQLPEILQNPHEIQSSDGVQSLNEMHPLDNTQFPQILTAVLLDKRERREVEFTPDFVGRIIPDVFVVGYGMDYNELYRELPYIGIYKEHPEKA